MIYTELLFMIVTRRSVICSNGKKSIILHWEHPLNISETLAEFNLENCGAFFHSEQKPFPWDLPSMAATVIIFIIIMKECILYKI